MNPILKDIPRVHPNMSQLKNAMNMLKNANNPQALVSQMLNNSPYAKQINEIVQQNGGDYQKAFYSMANQLGIDPNEFLNNLK